MTAAEDLLSRPRPAPRRFRPPSLPRLSPALGGGLAILAGAFTRPVAFVLSGEMAVAYWMFHAPRSFFPVLNGGDADILYCFVFLYFVFSGPGAWSLDRSRSPAVSGHAYGR